MSLAAPLLGALAGLVAGPLLARLVHTAPMPGAWWAPWRACAVAPKPSGRERVMVTGLAAVLAGLAGAGAGWTSAWPAFVLVGLLAAPLVVCDLHIHRLPDRLTLPTAVAATALLGVGALATGGPWVRAVLAALGVFSGLLLVTLAVPRSFGMGDVKLAGVLALLLGWVSTTAVLTGLLAALLVGAAVALGMVAAGRASMKTAVPFGPSLVAGELLVLAALGP